MADRARTLASGQEESRDFPLGSPPEREVMKEFFEVVTLPRALEHASRFPRLGSERVPFAEAGGRVLARDLVSDIELPGFRRSTMDGFAVRASSTFGASEAAPALLEVVGSVSMGATTDLSVGPGHAARILTGGMLPSGADSVVMIEHTEALDETTIEVTRSVAPRAARTRKCVSRRRRPIASPPG